MGFQKFWKRSKRSGETICHTTTFNSKFQYTIQKEPCSHVARVTAIFIFHYILQEIFVQLVAAVHSQFKISVYPSKRGMQPCSHGHGQLQISVYPSKRAMQPCSHGHGQLQISVYPSKRTMQPCSHGHGQFNFSVYPSKTAMQPVATVTVIFIFHYILQKIFVQLVARSRSIQNFSIQKVFLLLLRLTLQLLLIHFLPYCLMKRFKSKSFK